MTLLAQIDRPEAIEALRRGFQQECSNTHFVTVLVAGVVVAGVLALIWLCCRRRPVADRARVTRLAEGAHVLGLAEEELDDLRTVAGRAAVPHPAAMLLSPANLACAARAARATGQADAALQQRLDRLAQRLYGRSLADCEAGPGSEDGAAQRTAGASQGKAGALHYCDCEPEPPERVS